ncbi:MAG: hypothetical protein V3U71_07240 [Cocleimonas sp.]
MDSIFLLTVGFIFLGALFSNIMKWRNKDRVLKDLQGFHSTIEMQDSKKIWGETQVYSNGMELFFSRGATNSIGTPINSYILYRDDIDKIRVIYRNHSELSKENQLLRKNEVEVVSCPSLFHIIKRKTRIFFNMFNDAIGEALSVFLSRMKGTSATNTVFSTQSDYLKKMGTTALSAAGNSYNPILERYINKRVVVSVQDENDNYQFCGFLKEYSSAWLSILDCKVTDIDQIDLDDLVRLSLQRDMDFSYYLYEKDNGDIALDIILGYFGATVLNLIAVNGGDDDKDVTQTTKDYHYKINKTLKHGESISFTLSGLPQESFENLNKNLLPLEFEMIAEERREDEVPEENEIYQSVLPEIKLEFESTDIADIYVPRTLAILRHGAE